MVVTTDRVQSGHTDQYQNIGLLLAVSVLLNYNEIKSDRRGGVSWKNNGWITEKTLVFLS